MPSRKDRHAKPERQVAALPLRLSASGHVEVLLITSRETGRWVIPKGNPMKGIKKPKVARIEAFEEAGVVGKVASKAERTFDYWKRRDAGFVLCRVDVFVMLVTRLEAKWKEAGQRRRLWLPSIVAAQLVLEPGLQAVLSQVADDRALAERLKEHLRSVDAGALDIVDDPAPALVPPAKTGTWRFRA